PYVPPRANNRRYDNRRQESNHLGIDALTKRPKEILATEFQLQLPPCPPMVGTPKKENLDRYCDYHGEKDVRQIGNAKGMQHGNNNSKGKVINLVWAHGDNKKRKSRTGGEEDWLNVPITFPLIPADDVSDEPLIVEVEVEGKIELEVLFENESLRRRTTMKFTVERASSPYNIIMRRTGMRELLAVSSTIHAMMKFPTPREEKAEEKEPERQEDSTVEEVLVNLVFPE
ncbi:hypothetical protein Tco_1289721, partial [Tanacetum coccineum]